MRSSTLLCMFNTNRKYWGWGTTTHTVAPQVVDVARYFLAAKLGVELTPPRDVPTLDALRMPAPKIEVPQEFQRIMTQDRYHRAVHTYGKAFRDVVRALDGDFSPAPDLVAYPDSEGDITPILAWPPQHNAPGLPFAAA